MEKLYTQNYSALAQARVWAMAFLTALTGFTVAQNSWTFTPCGATGATGPTQLQVNSTYTSGNTLNGSVTISGQGIQQFTVPTTGIYIIEARGARGFEPSGFGGRGAIMKGEFNLTAGAVLKIAVGQEGQINPAAGTLQFGGGGGSFVALLNNTPLNVAGGGGGSHANSYAPSSADGTISTSGNTSVGSSNTTGGTAGAGGAAVASANGGAGFYGDGGGTTGPALSFTNGALGGNVGAIPYANGGIGGFGGGGGTQSWNNNRGGGGGGYSGGGGASLGQPSLWGGGGGSFNSGSNQQNTSGANTAGDGLVIITEACNISLYAANNTNSLNPIICSGQSLTLTTNAISNYSWSTGATTSSLIVSPTTNTVYALTATSPSNCTASKSISITVSSGLPVLSIANPSNNICLGKTVSLTATGAITYTWANPGVVNGQTFAPTATTVYTVTGQNGCGLATSNTTITVAPIAITAMASPTLVCQGYPTTLTAVSAATSFTWMPGSMPGFSTVAAPTSNSIYTVSASDGTCSGTQTVAVNTKVTPTVNVSATQSVICDGDQTVLSATGANNYTWMPGNLTGNTVTVSPTTSTVYVVTGENGVGCAASNQQIMLVMPSPTINITASKMLVCAGQTVYLNATGGNGYTWTGGPGASTASYVVSPNATTVYTVTGGHALNICTTKKTITISALAPTLTLPTNTQVCVGGSVTVYASGATNYLWNSVSSGSVGVYTIFPPTTNTVTLIAITQSLSTNCPTTHTFEILVNPLPTLTVTATRAVVCRNETNTLTVSGAQTYTWTSTVGGTSMVITPSTSLTYTVAGTNTNGCVNVFNYPAKVNACNGIDESSINTAQFQVYPNPNNGLFIITSESTMDLVLVNELGQELTKFKLQEANGYKYEFKDLKPGIYFIHNKMQSGAMVHKVVVN